MLTKVLISHSQIGLKRKEKENLLIGLPFLTERQLYKAFLHCTGGTHNCSQWWKQQCQHSMYSKRSFEQLAGGKPYLNKL